MKALGTSLLLAILVLAGCTPDAQPTPTRSAAGSGLPAGEPAPERAIDEIPTTSPEPLWRRRVRTFGQPVVVGATVVVLAIARGREIDIRGLDLRTGRQRWSFPFSPQDEGMPVAVRSFRSAGGMEYVVFQNPGTGIGPRSSLRLSYLAVDPATGKVRARTRPFVAGWPAVECQDDLDVCLEDRAQESVDKTRWDLDRFTLSPIRKPRARLASFDGVHGFYSGGNDPSAVSVIGRQDEDGHRVWHTRVRDLVGKGWRYLYGGGLRYHEEARVFALGLRKDFPTDADLRHYERGKPVIEDLTQRRLMALGEDDGEPVWTHDGADFGCAGLRSDEQPVRCVVSGQIVYRRDREEPSYRGVHVTVEGYDPETGETTWSQPLSRKKSRAVVEASRPNVYDDGGGLVDTADIRVVETPDGPALLSLVDGSSVPLRRSARMLCEDEWITFGYAADSNEFVDRHRGSLRHVCTPDGERAPGLPSAYGLYQGAVDAGDGVFLFASATALRALEVPAE